MKYYLVAPLTYIGRDSEVLTYSSEMDLKNGQAVTIPLRTKEVVGLVVGDVERPKFVTKSVTRCLYEKPVITKPMSETVTWISNYYGASMVSVLQNVVPSGIMKARRAVKDKQTITAVEKPQELTNDQRKVFTDIESNDSKKPHLLFGVTGSGKTEVYLQLVQKTLADGKQAIILVPEIALTPQTIKRFKARFGDQVVLLHSKLKETERYRNWEQVLLGQKNVIIGSRSALFAPCDNLGLIVIDEEHENTYKQDKTPRYNASSVAEKLAAGFGAKLVYGSATPSVNLYYRALNKEVILHQLNKRIVQDEFPTTQIVDMRNEFKAGNKSIFSEKLAEQIKKTLADKKQIILFINRRGMSTFVSCRDCGHIEKCPNCDIPLTFHMGELNLKCHHCSYTKKPPVSCPACKSWAIKYFGIGTQRVEEEIQKLLGKSIKIARMDSDTTKERTSHEKMFESFKNGESDILIGTQMIAKGLDLPNVNLVGVISADTLTNLPDFTSAERTFDLLTQVAGRTGRGEHIGMVIIQTYQPDNFAIKAASKHDYTRFYKEEIENRNELGYPPFAKLIKLLYNNVVQESAEAEAIKLSEEITKIFDKHSLGHSLLGPAPAFIPKRNGKYWWQIVIKLPGLDDNKIIDIIKLLREITNNDWSIDVDPSDLI